MLYGLIKVSSFSDNEPSIAASSLKHGLYLGRVIAKEQRSQSFVLVVDVDTATTF